MKSLAIFGSSGSIGLSTLEVVRKYPDRFRVEILTVNSNTQILESQIKEFNPSLVVIRDPEKAREFRRLAGYRCEVMSGDEGLIAASSGGEYDIFVGAMVGFAGLPPTIEAIKRSKRIALANKETLVVAGEIVIDLSKKYDTEILPVDSEHSAIFQCLTGEEIKEVSKLILTASGGPFFNRSIDELSNVSIADALNHPTWKMGNKITIDSASLMNKGLEIIEAHWLFNLPKEKIDVVVHPQSIIHSMVEFVDGSIKAQLSVPDMKIPIQYALTYPERLPAEYVKTNFPSIGTMTFFLPNMEKFRCLRLAYDVMETGGTAPCILNAANEVAVNRFLNGEITFTQIPELIEETLQNIEITPKPTLEEILDCDKQSRAFSESLNIQEKMNV
ncbi:MAG: 1-deoxy-D-xylulose-5-phosphate reductoisomerase [Ignavibacteriaceae bacterium]|nr:1-deoxy-D-xylulose-5-phosphate reductoisomerase [Ignavibacteriaceae bacterium]